MPVFSRPFELEVDTGDKRPAEPPHPHTQRPPVQKDAGVNTVPSNEQG